MRAHSTQLRSPIRIFPFIDIFPGPKSVFERTAKVLIRLRGCAVWSGPSLATTAPDTFSLDAALIMMIMINELTCTVIRSLVKIFIVFLSCHCYKFYLLPRSYKILTFLRETQRKSGIMCHKLRASFPSCLYSLSNYCFSMTYRCVLFQRLTLWFHTFAACNEGLRLAVNAQESLRLSRGFRCFGDVPATVPTQAPKQLI